MTAQDDADKAGDDSFADLEADANKYHAEARKYLAEARTASGSMIVAMWHSGTALNAIKTQLKHGEFGRWRDENFDGDATTASRYMKIARNFARVQDLDPDLSLRATLKLISGSDDESSWEPRGRLLGSDWLRILQAVEPYAEHDKTVPMLNTVLLEATDTGIDAVATNRFVIGVAHAEYTGDPFSVTLDLDRVNSLIALAKNAVWRPYLPWEVEIGVSDAVFGNVFGCRFTGGESGRIQSAFAEEGEVVCYDAERLARFTKVRRGDVVMSARTNKAAVVQCGDDFIGLLMPSRRPDSLIEWTLPDWIAETEEDADSA